MFNNQLLLRYTVRLILACNSAHPRTTKNKGTWQVHCHWQDINLCMKNIKVFLTVYELRLLSLLQFWPRLCLGEWNVLIWSLSFGLLFYVTTIVWFRAVIYTNYPINPSTPYHICSKIWTSTICYPILCLAGWVANSVDPDETPRSAASYDTPHSVASHLSLHCLIRPVCPNTYGEYGIIAVQLSLKVSFLYWFLYY